jgi:hypothetical protein
MTARVAPRLAERAVIKLFSTPSRPPASRRRLIPHDASLEMIPFEGRELAVWSLGAGPVVLLAHGWSGSADDLIHVAGVLRRARYRAVLFDMPAHGRSTGRRTDLPQMARAIRAVAEYLAGGRALHGIVGHSLGGAAAALALRDGLRASRAALISPPGRAEVYLDRLTTALGLPASLREGSIQALARYAGDLGRVSAVQAVKGLLLPGLVMHDRRDREVAWEEGRAIAEAWRGARLLATEGLGHRRLLADGTVLEALLDFMLDAADTRKAADSRKQHVASSAVQQAATIP